MRYKVTIKIYYFIIILGGYMRLRMLREEHDLKQTDLARILNCKQNTYYQYEAEKRQIPISSLKKLAAFYNTSIDYLVEFTDEITPYTRKSEKNK